MEIPSVYIREYTVEALSVSTRESFAADQPVKCQINVQFGVAGHPESEHAFKVDLKLTFDTEGLTETPNLPYETSVLLHGFFDTPAKIAPDAVPANFVLNALMILYGVARGYIGEVTGSYGHGHFVIPSVVFDSLVERASHTQGSNVVPTPPSVRPVEPSSVK